MKIILTNLFTTLCCQRKRIRDKLNSSLPPFPQKGRWGKIHAKFNHFLEENQEN